MSPNKHSCEKEVVSGVLLTLVLAYLRLNETGHKDCLLSHFRLVLR